MYGSLCTDIDLSLLSLEFGDFVACSSSKYLWTLSSCDLVRKLAETNGMLDNVGITMVLRNKLVLVI